LCWGAWGEKEYIAGKIVRVDVDDDISASDICMLELDDSSGTFHRRDTMSCCVMPTKNTCDPSHQEAVFFPLRDGANINIHVASTPERSHLEGEHVAVEEVGCADDVLVKERSADDVVAEEEGCVCVQASRFQGVVVITRYQSLPLPPGKVLPKCVTQ
jgi:hypothetical protein